MRELPKQLFDEASLYDYLEAYTAEHKLEQTKRALPFAQQAHAGQLRDCSVNLPYIIHPMQMVRHAISIGLTEDALLAAALLHDVCEDCGIPYDELPGDENVKEAVRRLTKEWEPHTQTEEDEERYYERISENRIASMVKLLDRCNNVSSMADAFSRKRLEQYILETETYFRPLIAKVAERFPEYEMQLFAITYQMNSVLTALERMMKECR